MQTTLIKTNKLMTLGEIEKKLITLIDWFQ